MSMNLTLCSVLRKISVSGHLSCFKKQQFARANQTSFLCYLPKPLASADTSDLGFDNS